MSYPEAAWERAMTVQEVMLKALSEELHWFRAADILGWSPRTLRRWRERYEQHGYVGLADKRLHRPSIRRVAAPEVARVLQLYRERYRDSMFGHFHQIVRREHGVTVSYSFLKQTPQAAGLVKKHRARAGGDRPGSAFADRYNRPVSHAEHKAQAPASVACYVLTVSDSRTPDTDTSGRAIREMLEGSGHLVTGHAIVKDDPAQVTAHVRAQLADPRTQVVVTTGGTGVTSRDGTFEAIDRVLETRLDGFGELFRMLSFQEIGAAAMLSRATAGTASRKAIFVLPGSEHAVRLAMTRLILPELGHVMQQLSK